MLETSGSEMLKAEQALLHVLTVIDEDGAERLLKAMPVVRAVTEGRLRQFGPLKTLWDRAVRPEGPALKRETLRRIIGSITDLFAGDQFGARRFIVHREAVLALADGRLDPKEAMKKSGFLVPSGPNRRAVRLDLVGYDAASLQASNGFSYFLTSEGCRPATVDEWRAFVRHNRRLAKMLMGDSAIYVMQEHGGRPIAMMRFKRDALKGVPNRSPRLDPNAKFPIVRGEETLRATSQSCLEESYL